LSKFAVVVRIENSEIV